MTKNVLLYGVGGQETVLASRLVTLAAMRKRMEARGAETIGVAQRSRSVVSHMCIGEGICSPMVPHKEAGIMIGFGPVKAARCLPYLRKDECVMVSPVLIRPMTASLAGGTYTDEEMMKYLKQTVDHLAVVNRTSVRSRCDPTKVLNVTLLSAAITSDLIGISLKEMKQTILKRVPKEFGDMNVTTLKVGTASGYIQAMPEGSFLIPRGWTDYSRRTHPNI